MHRARRAAGVVGVGVVAAVMLTGCIPGPPPLPQASQEEPIVQGQAAAGELREGVVPRDGNATIDLQIDERVAVVIGATSLDDEDLTLAITGGGTVVENDDASDRLDVFDFELGTFDPAFAAVLDAGEYMIVIEEWGGDASRFQLQVITSTTTVAAGANADFDFGPGQPALAMVPVIEGDEVITATSSVDTTLFAYATAAGTAYDDDDSGGDRNPRIELLGESAQQLVVVATGYSRSDSGTLQLSVE